MVRPYAWLLGEGSTIQEPSHCFDITFVLIVTRTRLAVFVRESAAVSAALDATIGIPNIDFPLCRIGHSSGINRMPSPDPDRFKRLPKLAPALARRPDRLSAASVLGSIRRIVVPIEKGVAAEFYVVETGPRISTRRNEHLWNRITGRCDALNAKEN
jgi:hypothetical protein